MKKHILLLLIAFPAIAFAQFGKGTIFLGGTLSTTIQSSDVRTSPGSPTSSSTNNYGLSPAIGFLINPKLALGGSVTYSSQVQNYDYSGQSSKYESIGYGVSPFLRYYIPISNSIYFAMQGNISLLRGDSKTTQSNGTVFSTSDNPFYTLGVNFRPMIVFFPSPKWGIEASMASVGYSYSRNLPDVSSSSGFGLNAGSFGFGVSYYFIKQ